MRMLSRENFTEMTENDWIGKKILLPSNDCYNDLIEFAKQSNYALDKNIFENKKFPLGLYFCNKRVGCKGNFYTLKLKKSNDDDEFIDSFDYIWIVKSDSNYKEEIPTKITLDKLYKKENIDIIDLIDLPAETLKAIINMKSAKITAEINSLYEELNKLK